MIVIRNARMGVMGTVLVTDTGLNEFSFKSYFLGFIYRFRIF